MTMKKPNLLDYDVTAASFRWDSVLKEDIWYQKGSLNAAYTAVDQPALNYPEKVALIWYDHKEKRREYTYAMLRAQANQFANLLQDKGLKKGERVFFFLPRVPEVYTGFLGTLKAGGVGGTLFPAFAADALKERLGNSGARFLVTDTDLYSRVKLIKKELPNLRHVFLIDEPSFQAQLQKQSTQFENRPTLPTDPAIMLYTSATGNTPVCGIVLPHQSIVSQKITAHWVLDLTPQTRFWCTADPGWITGLAYGILGGLANGATNILYQPRFGAEQWWRVLQTESVEVLYTAPTALRMLRGSNVRPPKLSHLRHICSVGEALEPPLITWSKKTIGLPIFDTYWQTETGAMMMVNFRSVPIKPGSMGKPIPGIRAAILDQRNRELRANQEGDLAFWSHWPSQMTGVWKNPARFQSYFRGQWFITGDRAYRDREGYYHFVGRADDVIKTAGERVGPFSVESTLASHPAVLEAGVIGKPDPLRGEIIKAFIVLKKGVAPSDTLKQSLVDHVKKNLAFHAYPKEIEFVEDLPKNRSGKIVRRILKAKELGQPMGDTSTLIKN